MKSKRMVIAAVVLLGIQVSGSGGAAATSGLPASKDSCLRNRACRVHAERAAQWSETGRLEEALAEYQAAQALRPTAWLSYNIARLLHRLERPAEALPYYRRYLETGHQEDPEQTRLARTYLAQTQLAAASAPPAAPPMAFASAPSSVVPPPSSVVPPTPLLAEPPMYKAWWLWSILGVIVAVGVADGVVAATYSSNMKRPHPADWSTWPAFHPFQ